MLFMYFELTTFNKKTLQELVMQGFAIVCVNPMVQNPNSFIEDLKRLRKIAD